MKLKMVLATSFMMIAGQAGAYDMFDRMKHPEDEIEGPRSLYDVEQCIVIEVDAGFVPIVYRRPDRPDESLIYYTNRGAEPIVYGLKRKGTGTHITIYNGLKWKVPVQRCLDGISR